MSKPKRTHRPKCAHNGCGERAFFEFDRVADYERHVRTQREWRCTRHTQPDSVLAASNPERAVTLTASRVPSRWGDGYIDGLFWLEPEATSGSGFTYGPGFKAYANDFPEGTQLTVTATVELPGDVGVCAPKCHRCGWLAVTRPDDDAGRDAARADVMDHKSKCPASIAKRSE